MRVGQRIRCIFAVSRKRTPIRIMECRADVALRAGANYASLKDISKLGRSILNSDVLSKAQTRRWLKPKSLLNDLSGAVGMPWEIERVQIGGRTVDLYTKDGDCKATIWQTVVCHASDS